MQIETKLVSLFKSLIGLLYWTQLMLIKAGLNGTRHCLMLWNYVSPKVVLPQRRNQPWLTMQIIQTMQRRNMYYQECMTRRLANYIDLVMHSWYYI